MTFLQSILLGIFQGVAEFLPISSSGHLLILKNLMNLEEVPMSYDIMLHVATLIVVVGVFFKKITALFRSLFRWIARKNDESDKKNLGMILAVLIATFITGCAGILLKDHLPESPLTVSCLLLVTGVILSSTKIVEIYRKKRPRQTQSFDVKSGIVVGFTVGIAQSIGVLPGISRSGITVSSALFVNTDKKDAGDISFLISIPAIVGAMLLDIGKIDSLFAAVSPTVLFAGMAAAGIAGLISLVLLLKLIRSGQFYYFAFYLIPAGIAGIIYFS